MNSQKTLLTSSKEITSLQVSGEGKTQLIGLIDQETKIVHPRVFNSFGVPVRVQVTRNLRKFAEYSLSMLAQKLSSIGNLQGNLALHIFDHQDDWVLEYVRIHENAALLKARAYNFGSKQFEPFHVLSYDQSSTQSFYGSFVSRQQTARLNRIYVCLDCEDPALYEVRVLKAIAAQEEILKQIKWEFTLDNLDEDDNESVPFESLQNIAALTGVSMLSADQTQNLNCHYRRAMNSILLKNFYLREETISHLVPFKPKWSSLPPALKLLTIEKDGKRIQLRPKTLSVRAAEFDSRHIFSTNHTAVLVAQLHERLSLLKEALMFDISNQTMSPQKFIQTQIDSVKRFNGFIYECIIYPLGSSFRQRLIEEPVGWFRTYPNRQEYYDNKLRHLTLRLTVMLKESIQDFILAQLETFADFLTRSLPVKWDMTLAPIRPSIMILTPEATEQSFQLATLPQFFKANLMRCLATCLLKATIYAGFEPIILKELFSISGKTQEIFIPVGLSLFSWVQDVSKALQDRYFHPSQEQWVTVHLNRVIQIIESLVDSYELICQELSKLATSLHFKEFMDINEPYEINQCRDKKIFLLQFKQNLANHFSNEITQYGHYEIDFRPMKTRLSQLCDSKMSSLDKYVIRVTKQSAQALLYRRHLLMEGLKIEPSSFRQLLAKQEYLSEIENAKELTEDSSHLYEFCQQFGISLPESIAQLRWKELQSKTQVRKLKQDKIEECEVLKRQYRNRLKQASQQIQEEINLCQSTFNFLQQKQTKSDGKDAFEVARHLKTRIEELSIQIEDHNFQQKYLQTHVLDFNQFRVLSSSFAPCHKLWRAVAEWDRLSELWLHSPLSEFDLNDPEKTIEANLEALREASKQLKSQGKDILPDLAVSLSQEIEAMRDGPLRLLKVFKKQGFGAKHLAKAGFILAQGVDLKQLSLEQAVKLGLMDRIDQLEIISNEAWNEFYLEQMLHKVQSSVSGIKVKLIYYKDRRGVSIGLIENYEELNSCIVEGLHNLESMQYNPMKSVFAAQIDELQSKSAYMSQCLEVCEDFQKRFLDIYPIFDSTEIAKQLPHEARSFNKVNKVWVELMFYIVKVETLYATCNGVNTYEKVNSIKKILQGVKISLQSYLQEKRQCFNRLYLLSDREMFQMYSNTNESSLLGRIIPKLFQCARGITIQAEAIESVTADMASLFLITPVNLKNRSIELSLADLEKAICNTIRTKLMAFVTKDLKNWKGLLQAEFTQGMVVCILVQQARDLQQSASFKEIAELTNKQISSISQQIVKYKKQKAKLMNYENLLVLLIYKVQLFKTLINQNVTSPHSYEIVRVLKYVFDREQLKVVSFDNVLSYGMEYLGAYNRVVVTGLTDRVQQMALAAIRYCAGVRVLGPAGTGKTQTLKDLAKLCGKAFIVANCSSEIDFGTLSRLIKAVVSTGVWFCLDEANRLTYETLSVTAQQLTLAFNSKRLQLSKMRLANEQILVDHSFSVFMSYNPNYSGRIQMPSLVTELFRGAAMVSVDEQMICQSMLLSIGFEDGLQLGSAISRFFKACQYMWPQESKYDFGLRSIKGIVHFVRFIDVGSPQKEKQAVLQAIMALVFPNIKQDHSSVFLEFLTEAFNIPLAQIMAQSAQRSNRFQDIFKAKNCAIVCGPALSGKSTLLRQYFAFLPKDSFEQVYLNTLSVKEMFGWVDQATKLWNDGLLTSVIKRLTVSSERRVLACTGCIYSEWVQNLNSVTDETRLLTLSSGESLVIPQNFKLIFITESIATATPATLSRASVISCSHSSIETLFDSSWLPRDKTSSIVWLTGQLNRLKKYFALTVSNNILCHWVLSYIKLFKLKPCQSTFVYAFSLIVDGLLSQQGRSLLKLEGINQDENILKKDQTLLASILAQKSQEIGLAVVQDRIRLTFAVTNSFYSSNEVGNKCIVLFGPSGSTKTFCLKIVGLLPSVSHQHVYLTRQSQASQLRITVLAALTKRVNLRLKPLRGKTLLVSVQDLNMPQPNAYNVTGLWELMNQLCLKGSWYSSRLFSTEYIESTGFVCSYSLSPAAKISLSSSFLKNCLPVFLAKVDSKEQLVIMKSYIQSSVLFESLFLILSKLHPLKCIKLRSLAGLAKSINYWKDCSLDQNRIAKILMFEVQRQILSEVLDLSINLNMRKSIREILKLKQDQSCIIHCLNRRQGIPKSVPQNWETLLRLVEGVCQELGVLDSHFKNNPIVVFQQLCSVLFRLTESLCNEDQHALLISLPKAGKQTLARLAGYILRSQLYQIQKKIDSREWAEQVKQSIKSCVTGSTHTCLVVQHYYASPTQRNDLNTLLNSFFLPDIYSETDYQELIYELHSRLLKLGLESSKDNAVALVKKAVSQKLHILLFGSQQDKSMLANIESYPTLARKLTKVWIPNWPEAAQVLIAQQKLYGEAQNAAPILARLHCRFESVIASTALGFVWQGLFFQFVQTFSIFYKEQLNLLKLEEQRFNDGLKIIAETHKNLHKTKQNIKKLQPTIMLMEKETAKFIKALSEERRAADQLNGLLRVRNLQCTRIIHETQLLRQDQELKEHQANEKLNRAWSNVKLIKSNHISEIKSLVNPSEMIRIVLTAIVMIFHQSAAYKGQGSSDSEDDYFDAAKRLILSKDANSICRMLTEFDPRQLDKAVIDRVQAKCFTNPKWNEKEARNANKAIHYFFLWIQATALCNKIYTDSAPIRKTLAEARQTLSMKQAQRSKTREDLLQLETKIANLTRVFKEKSQALEEYAAQVAKLQRMLVRGQQILVEIRVQKSKWELYLGELSVKLKRNLGNTIIMATKIVYQAPHPTLVRVKLQAILEEELKARKIHYESDGWLLKPIEIEQMKSIGISEKGIFSDNMQILKYNRKSFAMIDPQEEGIRLIKALNSYENKVVCLKIPHLNPQIMKNIQDCVINGKIMFVEIQHMSLPEQLSAIFPLKRQVDSKTGLNELNLNGLYIPLNPLFQIYLYTTNKKAKLEISFLSEMTVVNFTLSPADVKAKLVNLLTSIEIPEVYEQLSELTKIQIQDSQLLRGIEQKILQMFSSKSSEQILADDEVLVTLVSSNRLHDKISLKIETAQQTQETVSKEKQQFQQRANNYAQLYAQLQKLYSYSPYYNFSFSWFNSLVEKNPINIPAVLVQTLEASLPPRILIVAKLLVSQIQFNRLPWNALVDNVNAPDYEYWVEGVELSEETQQRIKRRLIAMKSVLPEAYRIYTEEFVSIKGILTANKEEVLASLSNELSQTSFFNKIVVVNCFRPECTLGLFDSWAERNLARADIQPLNGIRPILLLRSYNNNDSRAFLEALLKNNSSAASNLRCLPITGLNIEQLKTALSSAIMEQQWLLLESNNELNMTILGYLTEVYSETDPQFLQKFRLWISVDRHQVNSLPELFIQLCEKRAIRQDKSLPLTISQSFFRCLEICKSANLFRPTELNLQKYLISQLCVIHHLLIERTNYGRRGWLGSAEFSFKDLQFAVRHIAIDNYDKTLAYLPSVLWQLTHGIKLTHPTDVQLLARLVTDGLSSTIVDRGVFWQSLWGDDKFPKTHQEYAQYIKKLLLSPVGVHSNWLTLFGIHPTFVDSQNAEAWETVAEIIAGKSQLTIQSTHDKRLIQIDDQVELISHISISGHPYDIIADKIKADWLLQLTKISQESRNELPVSIVHEIPHHWVGWFPSMGLQMWTQFVNRAIDGFSEWVQNPSSYLPACSITDWTGFLWLMEKYYQSVGAENEVGSLVPSQSDKNRRGLSRRQVRWSKDGPGLPISGLQLWNAALSSKGLCPCPSYRSKHQYIDLPLGFLSPPLPSNSSLNQVEVSLNYFSPEFSEAQKTNIGTIFLPAAICGDANWTLRWRVHVAVRSFMF